MLAEAFLCGARSKLRDCVAIVFFGCILGWENKEGQ